MGKCYERIDDTLRQWLLDQPVFFVGTAPLDAAGHLNVSPKGMAGTFAVLGPHRIGYLDYYGSGAETIAHLGENGRIVIMCCAFVGPPKIVRLHGRGRVVLPDHPDFVRTRAEFGDRTDHALRSIIVVDVDRISDSCGYAVPQMEFIADREVLDKYNAKKPAEHFRLYHSGSNRVSIDGLPALGDVPN